MMKLMVEVASSLSMPHLQTSPVHMPAALLKSKTRCYRTYCQCIIQYMYTHHTALYFVTGSAGSAYLVVSIIFAMMMYNDVRTTY